MAELLDLVRSKVATQVERAGFTLRSATRHRRTRASSSTRIASAQIFINLVDNALEVRRGRGQQSRRDRGRRASDGSTLFTVRDFGPGVGKSEMKKVFELFYRAENELTRETVGTGIGLALVRQLAAAMGARVDVRNCEPGAEFRLHFSAAGSVNG